MFLLAVGIYFNSRKKPGPFNVLQGDTGPTFRHLPGTTPLVIGENRHVVLLQL